MQNQVHRSQTKLFTVIVAIITILNILATLWIGFLSYFAIGVGDPASDSVDIEAFIMQKQLGLTIVKSSTAFFVIGFVVALIVWLRGKRHLIFVLLGLGLLHLLALRYIDVMVVPPSISSFYALDLALLIVIFFNLGWQRLSLKT